MPRFKFFVSGAVSLTLMTAFFSLNFILLLRNAVCQKQCIPKQGARAGLTLLIKKTRKITVCSVSALIAARESS